MSPLLNQTSLTLDRHPVNADAGTIFLRRQSVEQMTGLSRSSIYSFMARNRFPKPIQIGPKAVRWSSREILSWMSERTAQRG
ncbi:helix-turn-helix transcriptional regulator [Achromobacter xylosoxidans]